MELVGPWEKSHSSLLQPFNRQRLLRTMERDLLPRLVSDRTKGRGLNWKRVSLDWI